MAPPLKDRLLKQQPEFNGQMIQLTCAQEIEYRSFKNKYTEQLVTHMITFGFPKLPFDFKLVEDTEALADAQVAFLEQRRLEEEELGKKALDDLQKREQEQRKRNRWSTRRSFPTWYST